MTLIAVITYLANVAVLLASVQFFLTRGHRRQEDEHIVAALLVSSVFFGAIYTAAIMATPSLLIATDPITSLWIGFDFFVAMVHTTIILAFSRRRSGRTVEDESHGRISVKRPQYK